MSYNYNDLVSEISKSRQKFLQASVSSSSSSSSANDDETTETKMIQHLQHAVDTFATLSSYCPMTPLLWMQYSYDTAKLLQLLSSLQQVKEDDDEQQQHQQQKQQGNGDESSHSNMMMMNSISSLTTQIQLLELALAEFPGSAILHLYFLNILLKLLSLYETMKAGPDDDTHINIIETTKEKIRSALDDSIRSVGKGSHRNESNIIAAIYRIDATFRVRVHTNDDDWDTAIQQSFVERSKIPMKDVNDTLKTEYIEFCKLHKQTPKSKHMEDIEYGRRYESKTYSKLISYEDDIDIAMNNEGILPPLKNMIIIDNIENDNNNIIETFDWEKILQQHEETTYYWMGYGGIESSTAFHKYAQTCYRYRSIRKSSHDDGNSNNDNNNNDQDDDQAAEEEEEEEDMITESTINNLAPFVYERGVAECPTVESIWLSYIQHLQYLLQNDNDNNNQTNISSKLLSVVDRATRNCPYSHQLVQQKLKCQLLLADIGLAILDPDELVKTIQDALDMKFITTPNACLQLYMTAIEVIRRRILSILATIVAAAGGNTTNDGKSIIPSSYDDTEPVVPAATTTSTASRSGIYNNTEIIDDNKREELQDLSEDLREFYDTTDTYLRKKHSAWSEGRLKLWSDRSLTESMILTPLMIELSSSNDDVSAAASAATTKTAMTTDEVMKCYEKMIKVHQPCHPDSYAMYINNFTTSNFPTTTTEMSGGGQSISWILSRLRQTRFLYQKAVKLVGKPKKATKTAAAETTTTSADDYPLLLELQQQRDYETSLQSLCHGYLMFEKTFGSDRSIANASKNIQKKLSKSFVSINNSSKEKNIGHQQGQQNKYAATAGNNKSKTTPSTTTTMRGHHQHNGSSATTKPSHAKVTTTMTSGSDEDLFGFLNPNDGKDESGSRKKRSREDVGVESTNPPVTKKQKAIDHPISVEKPDTVVDKDKDKGVIGDRSDSRGPSSRPAVVVHKVKVGNLEYPAHPFTVRISKLHTNTQDMDLVDALKPKCGAIVHSRIMRERHHQHQQGHGGNGGRDDGSGKGKSKGWALVQFEERESVEKALELSGIIGIHQKLVVIERSHMPAVALVPPGMHRVNPKGEGKKSKFNQHRKEKMVAAKGKNNETFAPTSNSSHRQRNAADKDKQSSRPISNMSILAFQPRGVQHSQKHRKVKVDIPKKDG